MRSRWHDIKCGRHSGFAWCCILSFITIWRWRWYREWFNRKMDETCGTLKPIQYVLDVTDSKVKKTVDYYVLEEFRDWGMVPCLFHYFLRRRPIVKACVCFSEGWTYDPKMIQKMKANHPHLLARHLHD